MHSHITPEGPHPLLSADLLALSREAEDNEKEKAAKRKCFGREEDTVGKGNESVPESCEEDEVAEIKEGLGTLTLHHDGRIRFYGPTAGIEVS